MRSASSGVGSHDRGDHFDKVWMVADGSGAYHSDADLARYFGGLDVEIVKHFDMIAEKSERLDDYVTAGQLSQHCADIRLQPGLAWVTATALKGEGPMLDTQDIGNQSGRLVELIDIRSARSHRERDTMRGEDEIGRPPVSIVPDYCLANAIGDGCDKRRMVVPALRIFDGRRRLVDKSARSANVLLV